MCPNHISVNIIPNDLKKFKEVAVSLNEENEEIVNFNKLVPMPNDLHGNYAWDIEDRFGFGGERFKVKLAFQTNTFVPFLSQYYNEEITQKDFINTVREELSKNEILLQRVKNIYEIDNVEDTEDTNKGSYLNSDFVRVIGGFFNYTRYGHYDRYYWCTENWGTKWNAYHCHVSDSVSFQTAWAVPTQWLEKLAEHIDFKFSWADEDLGCNLGCGIASNGKLILNYFDDNNNLTLQDRQYLALAIQGYDYEEEMAMYDEGEEEPLKRPSFKRQEELHEMIRHYI